ncbi:MAG: UvrD-helicase domain-containing protein [bacterium]|nr:UvrD-helicase domain-containing protein [bacterium]
MTTVDLLSGLNPAQREAVSAGSGPVLVLAGPGSGKTRVLTHRIAYLVQEMGIPPRGIVAVTFTNKAAAEMRNRTQALLGASLDGLQIGTFHSICSRLLRIEADSTPYGRDYVIYDTDEQITVMKAVITELNIDQKKFSPSRVLYAVSAAKNELLAPDEYPAADYFGEIVQRAYPLYQRRMIDNNAMDFDDLLMQTVVLLRDHEAVRQKYQQRFEHLLVDEFQDTNTAQYRMVKLLAGQRQNVFVVGDEDQSIYAFRGADYRNVMQFRKDYPEARVILLEQNYRSTQVVLDVARNIIDKNPHRTKKQLFTEKEGGALVKVHEAYSETEEGVWIVDEIRALMRGRGLSYRDFAVMYRINAQSRALEDAFKLKGVPYRIVGGVGFYQRREVRDVVAYLRVINNPTDGVSLNRIINVPTRGIGEKTAATFHQWVAERGGGYLQALEALASGALAPLTGRSNKALVDFARLIVEMRKIAFPGDDTPTDLTMLYDEIMARTGYAGYLSEISDTPEQITDRIENLRALRGLIDSKKDLALDDFLADVSLNVEADTDTSDGDKAANSVTLLTLHAAKGLEYPVVFITGVEDGILPHSRSLNEPDEMAEERRLMYVGLTRAREQLYLTYAFRRSLYGESVPSIPSRFFKDVPAHLTEGSSTQVKHMSEREAYREATRWDRDDAPRHLDAPRQAEWQPPTRRTKSDDEPRSKVIAFPGTAASGNGAPRTPAPRPPDSALKFKARMKVYHPKLGIGVVVDSQRSGDDELVTVKFDSYGTKTMMAGFAKMRIIDG